MFIKYLRPFFFSPQITKYCIFNYGWLKLYFIEIYLNSSTYFYLHFNPCHIVVFVPELFQSSQSQKNKNTMCQYMGMSQVCMYKDFCLIFFRLLHFYDPRIVYYQKLHLKEIKIVVKMVYEISFSTLSFVGVSRISCFSNELSSFLSFVSSRFWLEKNILFA